MPTPIPTPEIDKMHAVKAASQAIGEFLEWLQERRIELAQYHEHSESCEDEEGDTVCGLNPDRLYSFHYQTEKLLAEYFEIDLRKVEDEKQALLDQLRASQPQRK